jgi:hypothetical protein
MIKLLRKLFCRHYYKYSSINYKIGDEQYVDVVCKYCNKTRKIKLNQ